MLKESVQPHARKINVMCLQHAADADGIYVVDPEFNGETGKPQKDTARIELLFDARPITGEVWRPIEGGHAGQRAWCAIKR